MQQQLSQEIKKIFDTEDVIIISPKQQLTYGNKWARIIESLNTITVLIRIIDYTERESVFNSLHAYMEKYGYEYREDESEKAAAPSFVSKWVFYS